MNAYELFDAAFDSACDGAVATTDYVKAYADGAFDIALSDEVASKIVECHKAWKLACVDDGQWTFNYDYYVRLPLESIEI